MRVFQDWKKMIQNDETAGESEKNQNNSEFGESKEYLVLLLLLFVLDQQNDMQKLWQEFQNEVKHNNRFFPQSELLERIRHIADYATVTLRQGTVLYRAREYAEVDYLGNTEVVALREEIKKCYPDMDFREEDMLSESAMYMMYLMFISDEDKRNQILETVKKAEEQMEPFWGYDKRGCDAPPAEKTNSGRANPEGISYLYTAMDEKTAVMELKPRMNQQYNICKIRMKQEAKIFDFTYIPQDVGEDDFTRSNMLYTVSREFSAPNYGNSEDYLPTQYICELIKHMGFDGIRFKSSVSDNGINVILFDTNEREKLYEIMESRIKFVSYMDLQMEQVLPMGNMDD